MSLWASRFLLASALLGCSLVARPSRAADGDLDDMDDAWEILHLGGTNASAVADADGDGYLNVYEYVRTSDPTNALSIPVATRTVNPASTNAYATIQAALNAVATNYEIIVVASGVYTNSGDRNLDFAGAKAMLVSAAGPLACTLDGMNAGRGFYFHSGEKNSAVVSGLTITNATAGAGNSGGAFYCTSASSPTIHRCRILLCTAVWGAALNANASDPRLWSTMIVSNRTQYSINRGAIYLASCNAPEVVNCTIAYNTSTYSSGGLYTTTSYPRMNNCILWGNTPAQIFVSGGSPSVTYSAVQGGYAGTGNITNNPAFADSLLRLSWNSPCVDAGTNTGVLLDWEREPRRDVPEVTNVNSAWDIGADEMSDRDADGLPDWWEDAYLGSTNSAPTDDDDNDSFQNAYEYVHASDPGSVSSVPTPTHYVALNGSHTSPYDTWAKAATNLQAALSAAVGDYALVCVADGSYVGAANRGLSFPSQPAMLFSQNGRSACVFDAQGGARLLAFTAGQGRDSVFAGFTVTNAATSGYDDYGGAIYCDGASPTIRDSAFLDCASYAGGAICSMFGASPLVQNCVFARCEGGWGGAVAAMEGGSYHNCLFIENQATEGYGGAIEAYSSYTDIRDCTIVSNSAPYGHAAIYALDNPTIQNCILWANTPAQIYADGGTPSVTYSLVQGGYGGTGNITNAPQFADALYRVSISSPAVDAGTTNLVVADWEGEPRWDAPNSPNTSSVWDMGWDEFHDGDDDGMPDWWERNYFGGTNGLATDDADGDGCLDIYEYRRGGNPTNAQITGNGTHFVSIAGSHTAPFDTWAKAATNIQAALNVATNGYEIVCVADGIYTGALNMTLSLPTISPVMLVSTGGPDHCILDGLNTGRLFGFSALHQWAWVVSGFTVRNGRGANGGAVYADQYASPTIHDCIFTNNAAVDYESNPTSGGAIFLHDYTEPRIWSSVFADNSAGGHGGAIFQNSSTALEVIDTVFLNNAAGINGGGLATHYNSRPTVSNCAFRGNVADQNGGALYCNADDSIVLTDCELEANAAPFGAGIEFYNPTVAALQKCRIARNTASANGGGLMVWKIGSVSRSVTIEDCELWGNVAHTGGGIYVTEAGNHSLTIEDSGLWGNIASSGGGIYVSDVKLVLKRCGISNNLARIYNDVAYGDGAGIYAASAANVEIENCTVSGNRADGRGGALFGIANTLTRSCNIIGNLAGTGGAFYWDAALGGLLTVQNSILRENAPDEIAGSGLTSGTSVTYSDICGGWAGAGNFDTAPRIAPDGHLRANSPCIDAGVTNAVLTDLEDEARWDDPTHPNVTTNWDVGIDEFVDTDADGLPDAWEWQHVGDLSQAGGDDVDDDGFSNGEEHRQGTDPLMAEDRDADGITDGKEALGQLFGWASDKDEADSDRDGLVDAQDPLPNSPVGDQDGDGSRDDVDTDDDNDGILDVNEPNATARLSPDRDGDGVPDGIDSYPDNPNLWGTDTTPPVLVIVEPVNGATL